MSVLGACLLGWQVKSMRFADYFTELANPFTGLLIAVAFTPASHKSTFRLPDFRTHQTPEESSHPTQTMAGQRPPISLAALSKQVSDAISYNIHDFLDEHSIGQAVLQTVWDDDDIATFGGFLASENAEKAVQEAVGDTCNDEAIEEAVTKALQDAGFTNDPPALEAPNIDEEKKTEEPVATAIKAAVAVDLGPQPSVAMDVTALREQTLGSLLPSPQITHNTSN
jgi:hypothetical protein